MMKATSAFVHPPPSQQGPLCKRSRHNGLSESENILWEKLCEIQNELHESEARRQADRRADIVYEKEYNTWIFSVLGKNVVADNPPPTRPIVQRSTDAHDIDTVSDSFLLLLMICV